MLDAPASHEAPPPHAPVHDYQHHRHRDPPTDPTPEEPPPSYDDTTALIGAPPGYGTFRPYADGSSTASSEVETTDRSLPECVGQVLVVFIFVSLMYGFWKAINVPDESPVTSWLG
ncbi:hypothetical protein EJ02DRAFT_418523 [Clathrospora elynae]|uniref:Uncharacterized protein n=1 Tax=Clathrospora elynae TaxID=706981 RepID=A0A6A5T1B8_9PLEO|nr:hypothetical protein EJ02DRAFT_418523 [Clathrospora elynae]